MPMANGTPDWQQTCGDSYVRGTEACDTGGASASCTAVCLRTDDQACTAAGQCVAGVCVGGACGGAATVDLADPDVAGVVTTTTVTPNGTTTRFLPGDTITVTVNGPGVSDATCAAMVAADLSFACTSPIAGLQPGGSYTAVAAGDAGGGLVSDSETFAVGDCAGLGLGDACTSGGSAGVCDAGGGGGGLRALRGYRDGCGDGCGMQCWGTDLQWRRRHRQLRAVPRRQRHRPGSRLRGRNAVL